MSNLNKIGNFFKQSLVSSVAASGVILSANVYALPTYISADIENNAGSVALGANDYAEINAQLRNTTAAPTIDIGDPAVQGVTINSGGSVIATSTANTGQSAISLANIGAHAVGDILNKGTITPGGAAAAISYALQTNNVTGPAITNYGTIGGTSSIVGSSTANAANTQLTLNIGGIETNTYTPRILGTVNFGVNKGTLNVNQTFSTENTYTSIGNFNVVGGTFTAAHDITSDNFSFTKGTTTNVTGATVLTLPTGAQTFKVDKTATVNLTGTSSINFSGPNSSIQVDGALNINGSHANSIQATSSSSLAKVGTTGVVNFSPASTSTITLAGNVAQVVRGNGQIIVGKNATVTAANADLTLGGTDNGTAQLILEGGTYSAGAGRTLTLGSGTANQNGQIYIKAPSTLAFATVTPNGTSTASLKYDAVDGTLPKLTVNSLAGNLNMANLAHIELNDTGFIADGSHDLIQLGANTVTNIGGVSITYSSGDNKFIKSATLSTVNANNTLRLTIERKEFDEVVPIKYFSSFGKQFQEEAKTNTQLAAIATQVHSLSEDDEILDALAQLRPEVNFSSTSGAMALGAAASKQTIDRLASLRADGVSGYATGDMTDGLTAWFKGFGGRAIQKSRKGVHGYNAGAGGAVIGVDKKIMNDWTVGMGFGFGHTHSRSRLASAPNTTNIESVQALVYGGGTLYKDYFADVSVNVARNRYSGHRQFNIGTLHHTANFDYRGTQWGGMAAIGTHLYKKGFKFTPTVEFGYMSSSKRAYTEKVGESPEIGLDYQKSSVKTAEAGLGMKLSKTYKKADKEWTPDIHVKALYDFKRDQQTSVTKFVGGKTYFETKGPKPSPTTVNVGIGFNVKQSDSIEFVAGYDLELKSRYASHSGSVSLRYMW